MIESSLHRQLVKLYLEYFNYVNTFEEKKTRTSYQKIVKTLKEIENLARTRRAEVREKYKSTDEYKILRDTVLRRKIEILEAKKEAKKNKDK